jgi:predicted RNA-binding Zn ribbon-like protein
VTEPPPPAGELELVRRFVNSADIEAGQDELAGLTGWQTWASRNGYSSSASSSSADLRRLVELREALREALQANHDRTPMPPASAAELTRAAEWASVRLRFGPEGAVLESEAPGMRAVAAQVLAKVATAMADGTWTRLKVCSNDGCRWAFYDTSRSRTGQWCSMGICGNRAKQARYKARRVTGTGPKP